jgi:transposase-like protein
MLITPELLDELLKDYKSPDDMFGNDGLLQQLSKALLERALQGEMTHHLGYEKHAPEGKNTGNSMDALKVKVKDQGRVSNKAIYLAIGVTLAGLKEVLGLRASENEGAKFWLSVITELKSRGVRDIFLACVDGLKGFPEAIETVFPKT